MTYLICAFAAYGFAIVAGPLAATALVGYGKWREARWHRKDVEVVTERVLDGWARAEDDRRTRALSNQHALARLTDDDHATIEALIRETGCTPGRDELA